MPDVNDQWRQQAHAEKIREQRAEREKSPEQKEMEGMIAAIVERAVTAALAGFTIQSGTGITVSGSGRNMTIAAATGTGNRSSSAMPEGGEWLEVTDCDSNTFEVWSRNP